MVSSFILSRRDFFAGGVTAASALMLPQHACCTTPPNDLKVLSYNVWYGFTKKPTRKREFLAFVKSQAPSIVCLQELNGYTPKRLAHDARNWGHAHTALLKGTGFPTGLSSDDEITDVQRTFEGYHHGLMRCKTHGIYFYVIHLHPSNWEIRLKEIDLLLSDVATLPAKSKVLLVGDFNTFSPRDKHVYDQSVKMIPFFKKLDERTKGNNLSRGRLDYRHIERIEDKGFIDVGHHKRSAFRGTFPTKLRPDEDMGPERRLDYIFASRNLAETCQSAAHIVNKTTAVLSDHYPVIATFQLATPPAKLEKSRRSAKIPR